MDSVVAQDSTVFLLTHGWRSICIKMGQGRVDSFLGGDKLTSRRCIGWMCSSAGLLEMMRMNCLSFSRF